MDLELQKALYELFKSNLKFPFYDGLRDEVYPYGAFSYTEDRPLNTKTIFQMGRYLYQRHCV